MAFTVHDGISPELLKKAKAIKDKRPILEAMGLQLVSLTKRAFSDASLRAKPWPERKRPAPHNLLRKSGSMWQSIRVSDLTNDYVKVASDRVYAAHQQFGSKKKSGKGSGLPPRPFFPFASPTSSMLASAAAKIFRVAEAKIKSVLGAT